MSARTLARIVPVLLFLAGAAAASSDAQAPAWDEATFRSELDLLAALTPRLEGSAQERDALRYVRDRLLADGVAVRVISYAESETVHSFSSGIEVSIPGALADAIVVVVPVDQRLRAPAGGDGSAGIALGLTIVRALRLLPPALSVRLLFLGAEHGSRDEYPIGSRRYLEGFTPDGPVAFLYLDVPSIPCRLDLGFGTNGIVSPSWLVQRVSTSLGRAELPYRLRASDGQVYRLGVAAEAGGIAPYLRAGYPALALTGAADPQRRADPPAAREDSAWVEAFGRFFEGLLQELADGIPGGWDRHYLTFQLGSRSIIVAERTYVLLLCLLVALCLLYALVAGRRGLRYVKAFLSGIWGIPLHLGLLFAYVFLPTIAMEGLLAVLDFPTLWQQAPLQLLLLKALLGASLFALFTPLLTRRPFPRTDTFYGASAIALLVVDLIGTAAYEVSLAYVLAWALVFTFLSTLTRDRSAKVLLFVLAPSWLVRVVIELFWLRHLELIRWVLLDRITGNLLLVAAVAPYYFMVLRLRLLLPARRRRRRRMIILAAGLLCLLAASGTALWIGYLRPYRDGDARPIAAQAVFDYEGRTASLDLSCPIALRELTVVTASGASRTVTRSRHLTLDLPLAAPQLDVASAATTFLDRQNVHVELSSSEGQGLWPFRLSLRLVGEEEFVLFDASFPFLRDPSGREYLIRIGANPPSPLPVELTLPRGIGFELKLVAEYLEFPPELAVLSPGAVIEPGMEIRLAYRFRT